MGERNKTYNVTAIFFPLKTYMHINTITYRHASSRFIVGVEGSEPIGLQLRCFMVFDKMLATLCEEREKKYA